MSFYECYCDDCKSEADEIIEEARDKLVDLITEQANSEIKATIELNSRLLKTNEELCQKISNLENERNNLKTELNRVNGLNNVINPEFQIGEAVYYVGFDDWKKMVCPVCNGEKYITVTDTNLGILRARCPKCGGGVHGRSEVEHVMFKVERGYINSIKIIIKSKDGDIKYSYHVSDDMCYNTCDNDYNDKYRTELYRTKEEAQAAVDKRNAEAEEAARKKLNREEEQ